MWITSPLSYANIEDFGRKIRMCECAKVHMFEVEFKLAGMTVIPTHKNCGNALNDTQADKFQKELVKSWGLDPDDDSPV